jgi:hypothetical protein
MIKLSILTQPLGRNYGGLLQAYALQTILKRLGCYVETLDRVKRIPLKSRISFKLIAIAKFILIIAGLIDRRELYGNRYVDLESFMDNFLAMSPEIDSDEKVAEYFSRNKFDAFIVGSDQVWRPKYSPELSNYFLDFCDYLKLSARRIAYAASFGVDENEFSEEVVEKYRALAKKFDSISVREFSGVVQCREYFGVHAELVLDPTLLLEPEDYDEIIRRCGSSIKKKAEILVYILDTSDQTKLCVDRISKIIGKVPHYLINNAFDKSRNNSLTKFFNYPGVGDWLIDFRNADYIVTDSFHGCVFAILFNKRFVALGNKSRGMARFSSLLEIFELSDRLVSNSDEIEESIILEPIDWVKINEIKEVHKIRSMEFLKNSLFGLN